MGQVTVFITICTVYENKMEWKWNGNILGHCQILANLAKILWKSLHKYDETLKKMT